MSCAVKGCKNYNWKTRNMPGRKVQYFSFPKDNAMVLKWLEVCKKQDLSIAKARICSVHFEPSCFEKSLQQKLLQYSPKRVRKIRKDAIPTLHLFHNLQEKNTPLFHQLPERMDVSLDVESGSDAMTNTSMSSIVKYEEEIDDVIAPADVMDASLNANKAPDGMTNLPISTMHKADQDITALIYVNDSSEVIDAVPANVMDSSSTADT
ncbi:hypothetical protein ALC62_04628 [Cyphomyrmex costatus]|uniref:THAP-type domain-containing protein n=1 Tax=Cyphomyrmex costatus TaxID=456900 RepID=A0A195CW71_9HYME|nr:hypothetical protein ALC62_04628 [Cyphomyrmex costatus]